MFLYYFLVYVFLLVWWWLENKKGSGCATVLEYGDEIRDAVLMAFGENVTRISLATAKKYIQKLCLLFFWSLWITYFLINLVRL